MSSHWHKLSICLFKLIGASPIQIISSLGGRGGGLAYSIEEFIHQIDCSFWLAGAGAFTRL